MKQSDLKEKQEKMIENLNKIASEYLHIIKCDINFVEYNEDNVNNLKHDLNTIVIGLVIQGYNLVNVYLDILILNYYFPTKNQSNAKPRKLFSQYILDCLYLINKADFCNNILPLRKKMMENIHKINNIRNDLSHSIFPELRKKNRTYYKGESIYSLKGMNLFKDDVMDIVNYVCNYVGNFEI
jgi:hypothetical protein